MLSLHCPACGEVNNAVSQPLGKLGDDSLPVNGDFSVCFTCGEVATFAVGAFGIATRTPTMEELKDFAANPRYTEYVRLLHAFHAQRRGESTC